MNQAENIPIVLTVIIMIWSAGMLTFFIILIVNSSRYLSNLNKLVSHIRKNYPEIYKELGKPMLLSANPANSFSTIKLVHNFPEALNNDNDPKLQDTKKRVEILLKRNYTIFGVAIVWLLGSAFFFYFGFKFVE